MIPIRQVLDVALDGLDADLPFLSQRGAVGIAAFPELPVDKQQAAVLRLEFGHFDSPLPHVRADNELEQAETKKHVGQYLSEVTC